MGQTADSKTCVERSCSMGFTKQKNRVQALAELVEGAIIDARNQRCAAMASILRVERERDAALAERDAVHKQLAQAAAENEEVLRCTSVSVRTLINEVQALIKASDMEQARLELICNSVVAAAAAGTKKSLCSNAESLLLQLRNIYIV